MKARDNPFSTDRVLRLRYRLLNENWEDLLARLARLQYRAAVVGPKGEGKTTLLEELEFRLPAVGFVPKPVRLDQEQPRLPSVFAREFFSGLERHGIVLLDGAEQLNGWDWWRFRQRSRKAAGLIISSHRPGLLPTLIEPRTTPELLEELVSELLGQPAEEIGTDARVLFRRHGGNLREALRELYDWAAGQP